MRRGSPGATTVSIITIQTVLHVQLDTNMLQHWFILKHQSSQESSGCFFVYSVNDISQKYGAILLLACMELLLFVGDRTKELTKLHTKNYSVMAFKNTWVA